MSMSLLKRPAPPRSPERAALATAIEVVAAARADLIGAKQAGERASTVVWDAQQAVTDAHLAVMKARGDAVQHMVDETRGLAGTQPKTPHEARADLAEAEERLVSSNAVREDLKARIIAAENRLAWTEPTLRGAAFDVIAAEAGPQARRLVAELEPLLREIADKFDALVFLLKAGALPGTRVASAPWVMTSEEPAGSVMRHFSVAPINWHDPNKQVTGALPWVAALEGLMKNADTPLPK